MVKLTDMRTWDNSDIKRCWDAAQWALRHHMGTSICNGPLNAEDWIKYYEERYAEYQNDQSPLREEDYNSSYGEQDH